MTENMRRQPQLRADTMKLVAGASILDQIRRADRHDFLPVNGGQAQIALAGRHNSELEMSFGLPSLRVGTGERLVSRQATGQHSEQWCGPLVFDRQSDRGKWLAQTTTRRLAVQRPIVVTRLGGHRAIELW